MTKFLWIVPFCCVAGTVGAAPTDSPSSLSSPPSPSSLQAPAAEVFQAKDYSRLKSMPGFSDELVSMHLKLYEGYVKNANLLRQKLNALATEGKDKSPDYAGLKRIYGWEFDGMRLHELYFDNLGGKGGQPDPASPFSRALAKEFGSYDNWKKDFVATGLMRGIGWAVLYIDGQTV